MKMMMISLFSLLVFTSTHRPAAATRRVHIAKSAVVSERGPVSPSAPSSCTYIGHINGSRTGDQPCPDDHS